MQCRSAETKETAEGHVFSLFTLSHSTGRGFSANFENIWSVEETMLKEDGTYYLKGLKSYVEGSIEERREILLSLFFPHDSVFQGI